MKSGDALGIFFSIVLFIFGMLFTGIHSAFFVIGVIGFAGTVFFVVRIVSDKLIKMRRGNS